MNEVYNKKLLQNAQNLRKNMTKEEKHLWYDFLKNIPININRQKIIGNYIVDFYCASSGIVIELDGSQHYDDEGMENDIKRDAFLKALGLKVLRYSNLDIRNHFESVCNDILKHLDTSSTAKAVPLPLKGKAKIVLETERLILREMSQDDFADLCEILQDKETMYAYEHAFSDEEAQEWLNKQITRYTNDGFGLWAMIDKSSSEFVGQCGITWQDIGGEIVPEIGYLLKRKHWHNGYATEAAQGCKKYAFDTLGFDKVYSIIRDNNYASQNVAKRNGMTVVKTFIKHYYGMDMPHLVYCIERS